ncbi:MAG: hypothetical protein MZW92_22655 [Comamonadaceae bacterium]|nr:hypothetical protein [Comamonadaceae bacterium]
MLPRDAVTVQGSVLPPSGAAKLDVVRAGTGPGFAARAGGTIDPDAIAPTAQPGTPSATATLSGDAALAALDTDAAGAPAGERMFASVFNVLPETVKQQPATVQMSCSPCSAARLRDRVLQNPGRPIWIDGSPAIDRGAGDRQQRLAGARRRHRGHRLQQQRRDAARSAGSGRASTWTVSGTPRSGVRWSPRTTCS